MRKHLGVEFKVFTTRTSGGKEREGRRQSGGTDRRSTSQKIQGCIFLTLGKATEEGALELRQFYFNAHLED